MLNETNKRADDDVQVGVRFGKVSNTPNPDRTGPGFGTFVGSRTFDPNKGDKWWRHGEFEIVTCLRHFDNFKLMLVGMYRSPSMDAQTCDRFYDVLDEILETNRESVDILMLAGDDNSHDDITSGSKARRAYTRLEDLRFKFEGEHIIRENTRKDHQPDHVVAFYDQLQFEIQGTTMPGVGDHREMIIRISSHVVKPNEKRYHRKMITLSEGDPLEIAMRLETELSHMNHSLIDSWDTMLSGKGPFGAKGGQTICDRIFMDFRDTVKRVRERCRVTIWKNLPEGPGPLKSREERKVQYIRNKIFDCRQKIERKRDVAEQRRRLTELSTQYLEAHSALRWSLLEKEMSDMSRFRYHDSRRFFEQTGKMIKSDQLEHSLTEAEVDEKLAAAEENYKLRGPPLSSDDYCEIEPDAIFSIRYEIGDVLAAIHEAKKVESFYKTYARQLAPALSSIMYMISKYTLIPTEMKTTKLTFLKSRTIFSCSFETRVMEALVSKALKEVRPPESKGQMAYQPGRSTQLCVAIGLDETEQFEDLAFQWSADQKKAFDSARHATICRVMQKEAGAGKFTQAYLSGRTYRYRDRIGFQNFPMGRGIGPGTMLSPDQFSAFQGTNDALTMPNDVYVWTASFSDDNNPIAKWAKVLSGEVQTALDQTWSWSQRNFVDYHLSGKKAPQYFVFRKTGDTSSPKLASPPMLGSTPIERAYEATQLGISLKFHRDDEQASVHGYTMVWKSTKTSFSSIAYRLQDIRNHWNPQYRWDCVDNYFIGKINYGSCMYWLRAETRQIQNVRHYYAMAMASILGMQTPEITSMRCCKIQRVSGKHSTYLKLCQFLNMPTLRDLAIRDARVLLRQWQSYRPEQFITDDDGYIVSAVDKKPGTLLVELIELSKQSINNWYPEYNEWKKARKDPLKRHLKIDDKLKPLWMQFWDRVTEKCDQEGNKNFRFKNNLFTMMCRDHFDALEPYTRVRKQIIIPIKVFDKRPAELISDENSEVSNRPDSKKQRESEIDEDQSEIISSADDRTLGTDTREAVAVNPVIEPEVLEAGPADQSIGTRDVQASSASGKRKRKRRQTESDAAKTVAELTCSIGCPPVRGRKNRPCRICGFVIKKLTAKQIRENAVTHVVFECCDKEAHVECWQRARKEVFSALRCQEAKTWLAKDRVSPRLVPVKEVAAEHGNFISVVPCEFCGDLVRVSPENRNHVLEDCRAARTASQILQEPDGPARKRPPTISLIDRYYELLQAKMARRNVVRGMVPNPPSAGPLQNDRRANAADSEVT